MDKIREPLSSKYSAQLFDCGVPGKILETCEEKSEEGEKATLWETYVLSPRKLKKTSGVTCHATVSKFRGYCGAYLQQSLERRDCNPTVSIYSEHQSRG